MSLKKIYRTTIIILFVSLLALNPANVYCQDSSAAKDLDAQKRENIIKRISEVLNAYYVFPDVAKDVETFIKDKLHSGEYDNIKSLGGFTARLTKDIRSVAKDLHLRVSPYEKPQKEEKETDPEVLRQQRLAARKKRNFGFNKVEILDGNVGYVDFHGFLDAKEAGPTAIAALNFLSNCDSLIIDLRKNGGGQPSMSQLICSYFFDEPKHLNSIIIRNGDADITTQFWTQAHVQGVRLSDVPIYVLVSKETFSAAEGFAYALKHLGRATIVGETTRGGAHPQRPYDFPEESIMVNVPYGRAVNPITKTNWEGKGVIPNIATSADEALLTAQREALEKLRDKEEDESVKHGYAMIIEELKVKLQPVTLDEETLRKYTGSYSRGVKIQLSNGSLTVLGYVLVPMGNDKFMIVNGTEQIHFVRDDSGKIIKFVVVFRDGNRIPFDRLNDENSG